MLALIGIIPLFLILIIVTTVLSIAWVLWLGLLVVAPTVHIVMTGIRMQRWRQEQGRARKQMLGGRL